MRTTRLRGARTHNLRGVDLDLDAGQLISIVGVSGAGKSSLAFHTLYAEGQRRYVESFSAYARQFLERLARPPVDELDPVPAAIAVERQAPVKTSRSMVGTMTDIADYAKNLWARVATLHCPQCDAPVGRETPTEIAAQVLREVPERRLVVSYPVPVADAEAFLGVREALLAEGYRRVQVAEKVIELDGLRPSEAVAAGQTKLDVVTDRLVARAQDGSRLVEALEAAMRHGDGRATVWVEGQGAQRHSHDLHCARCDLPFKDASPALFSFNTPVGACAACRGFGRTMAIDFARVIPDRSKSLAQGAIRAWHGKSADTERADLERHAKRAGIPWQRPVQEFTAEQWQWLLDGEPGEGWKNRWYGLRGWFRWLEGRTYKMHVRVFLARYRTYETCAECHGTRLKREALAWRWGGLTLPQFYALPAQAALQHVQRQAPAHAADAATSLLLRECAQRLSALVEVGLDYLSLDRPSRTLSGGEAQRVALTGALGASLHGAMFVLDEPTTGLHPADVDRLIGVVRRLAAQQNVVLVVEHDEAFMRHSARVIELGPGPGAQGGVVVFDGSPAALLAGDTVTGRALRQRPALRRRRRATESLSLLGASGHNLQGVDLRIPLGAWTCVTGVSGSGKSSLVLETLGPAAAAMLRASASDEAPLPYAALEGWQALRAVVQVDQSPLGRTSRGNPATYIKAWELVRQRFAAEPLAKERGYKPGFFSFNVVGGRCEACKGEGFETVEMQFLADVTFSCVQCQGRRFVGPVLEVRHRGSSIADVLELTVQQLPEVFAGDVELLSLFRPLLDIGLGYLRVGQPLNTLSGGEAQRLKLAEALSRTPRGALLILDEPTEGLHRQDVAQLIEVLQQRVDDGDTVVVVEHDMHLVAQADHVVDLGPGGGSAGGRIVAQGTPEEVACSTASTTASFLAATLAGTFPQGSVPLSSEGLASRVAEPHPAVRVEGAREHNLAAVDIDIPHDRLVVVTGPSGSGKSTLAFDVVYAEAQRRYIETLSPYARRFMPQLPRPAVDRVEGLPPSVSLEQRMTQGASTSTVGTMTEVAHYLRLLYARIGLPHCPACRVPIAPQSAVDIVASLRARFASRTSLQLAAPVVRGRKGMHRELLSRLRRQGFGKARIDGVEMQLTVGLALDRYAEHDVDAVVAELRLDDAALEAKLDEALLLGEGSARLIVRQGKREQQELVSSKRACPRCGSGFPELDPRFFSFNTRHGACESCAGKGWQEDPSMACVPCEGTRLSPLARAVTVQGQAISSVLAQPIETAARCLAGWHLEGRDAEIGRTPLAEAQRRLQFLQGLGLGYLALDRAADTLSGGETQRVRLAAQLGSGLTGVLYVLDEPTIGLHPRDTGRLLTALRALVDRGSTVLVVEHDEDTIAAADLVIDMGPTGGRQGGRVVATGTLADLRRQPHSVTGVALALPASIPEQRRTARDGQWLELIGARHHNLQDVDLRLPLGCLVAVTGVSGSGKSTLVRQVLLPAVQQALEQVSEAGGAYRELRGVKALRRVVEIDQTPIGRTSRSVPATYIGIWDEIRKLLASTAEARARGYSASRFSFNSAAGRCANCDGQGLNRVEMAFLPAVDVPCESCSGQRFNSETLAVRWKDLHAGELLALEVKQAAEFFASVPKVAQPLRLLSDLGLGYLRLGQPSNTLSGGEAQRIKLVAELSLRHEARTCLYLLDEPTTGLHRSDVTRLNDVLQKLVQRGDTVVVIEHQLDTIVAADWVIDLGPEAGAAGGRIVAQGTPEQVMAIDASHTGAALKAWLSATPAPSTTAAGKKPRTKKKPARSSTVGHHPA